MKLDKKFLSPVAWVFSLTAAALVVAAILYLLGIKFYDAYDLKVYFASARWVIEGGRLYREVFSEYPLLANIIFATLRYLSNLLDPRIYPFLGLWIASAWFVYLFAVYRIATDTTILAALVWLAPAPIYFALFRFDLYPAVATLMSLFAIRRASYIEGAVWLGVAIALKGYALVLLPAFCVFMVYQRGFAAAIKVAVLAVAPMILGLLVILAFAGWEGIVAPFNFHAIRNFNNESTYDAINYLFGDSVIPEGPGVRWVAHLLQVGCVLAAAAMRPRSFEDLVNAFLFAVLGLMSFSVFYSPQFVLWILPLVCFSRSRIMLTSAIFFSWLTYLYYPISFELRLGHPGLYKAMVVAVSLFRLFMMFLTMKVTARPSGLEVSRTAA